MSWSRSLPVLAALALAGALAGCFQPLYSEAAHPGLVEDLRAIEVQPIKDRIGHYLADNLTTDLNGTGQTPTPKYKLTVTVSTVTSTPTVSSLTNVATSATMTGDGEVHAEQGRRRRASSDWRRQCERVLRSFPAALQRSSRRARHRDSVGARAVAGDFSAARCAARRENPMRAGRSLAKTRCCFT